jgi:hypothetical protein
MPLGKIGLTGGFGSSSQSQSSTETTQKILSQEGIDKILYDIMSSDQGLAALANAENASGGYGSSSKTLLAQDLIAKVAGEIANITAPTVTTSSSKTSGKSAKVGTVICTALAMRGNLPKDLYVDGAKHYWELNPRVLAGYHTWAFGVVDLMQKYQWLYKLLAPIAVGRYEMITGRKKITFWGAVTIYLGHPLCWLLSFFAARGQESKVA